MPQFYYYCGNAADLRSSTTKFLYAQYVIDKKQLHICAGNLESSAPFGWGEYVVYDLDPELHSFYILRGSTLVPLTPINAYISGELNYWYERDRQLVQPFNTHTSAIPILPNHELHMKLVNVKRDRITKMIQRLKTNLSNLQKSK